MQGRSSLKRKLVHPLDNTNSGVFRKYCSKDLFPDRGEEPESSSSSVEKDHECAEDFYSDSNLDNSADSDSVHSEESEREEKEREVKEEEEMAEAPQYIGDFARPVIGATTSAIVLPTAVRNYSLKPHDANMLPLFYGLPTEDALQFVRDFCTQVQTFPLLDITEDQLKLKCFQYALKDRARNWLLSLPPNSITTWGEACEKFMLKYYPNHKTQELRTQIMDFVQGADEPFHEAWERFQELLRQCPQHQLAPVMLCQFFYDGLIQTAQFMVDSTAGGNIARKTATELNQIFQTLAESSQQKSTRVRRVEASAVAPNCDLQKQLATVMRELQQLKMSKAENPPVREQNSGGCGICGDFNHGINECHRMGEYTAEGQAEVYSAQGYPNRSQFNQGLQNSGWRNQVPGGSGLSQENQFRRPQQMGYQNQQQQYFSHQQNNFEPQQQQYQNSGPSLEDTMQSFMQASKQAMEAQSATIKRLETTVGQLTGALNQLQQPQQTGNPQLHQAHAIELVKKDAQRTAGKWRSKTVEAIKANQRPSPPLPPVTVKSTQPLPKQGDPGSFIFDIGLGRVGEVSGMLDLGAAVNLMPFDIFEKLGRKEEELKCTEMRIQLADGSISSPRGLVEDVEVTVRGIRVLADFVVLDAGKGIRGENGHLVLLGRPFMATTQTRIDVGSGTLSMAGSGRSVTFSVFDKKPVFPTPVLHNCSYVKIFDPAEEECIVQEFIDNLQEEADIMQEEEEIVEEFLANLQEEAALEEESRDKLPLEEEIEQEFLDMLQQEDEVVKGVQCVLPLEKKKKEGSLRSGSRKRIVGRFLDAMSVVCSLGGPAAAIKEDVFSQALRQLKLKSDFG